MKQDNNEYSDARLVSREDAQNGAVIARLDGKPDVHCLVTNISAEGAELALGAGQRAPDRFMLRVPHAGMAYRAEVRWRKEGRIGVAFAGAEPLARTGPTLVAG